MKVLVTGGAGYMGSTLVPMLLEKGHQVRVLDSLLHGGRSMLGFWAHPQFEFLLGDLRDGQMVQDAVKGMDAVVHLAAIVGDPACSRDPDLSRAVNLEGSIALIKESADAGVARFVFASTCSNYGRTADSEQHADESSEVRPLSIYAETKVAAEEAVLELASTGMSPTLLRFATLFGLSPRSRFDLTVNQFAAELLTKRKLEVYGEQFWRPYVHVRDAARAIAMVLDAPLDTVQDQVFNVGDTSQNFQKGHLAEMVNRELGNSAVIKYVHKEEDPRDYRVSFEKINQALDFHITRSVEDGIHEVIEAINQGVITDWEAAEYHN